MLDDVKGKVKKFEISRPIPQETPDNYMVGGLNYPPPTHTHLIGLNLQLHIIALSNSIDEKLLVKSVHYLRSTNLRI